MFEPALLKKISSARDLEMGIPEAIISSIMKVDEKYHDELLGNIVLNGGNMMFRGMAERLVE